jgi:hypothetical protein
MDFVVAPAASLIECALASRAERSDGWNFLSADFADFADYFSGLTPAGPIKIKWKSHLFN